MVRDDLTLGVHKSLVTKYGGSQYLWAMCVELSCPLFGTRILRWVLDFWKICTHLTAAEIAAEGYINYHCYRQLVTYFCTLGGVINLGVFPYIFESDFDLKFSACNLIHRHQCNMTFSLSVYHQKTSLFYIHDLF